MLAQPMSSPMIMMMLGCLPGVCASAGNAMTGAANDTFTQQDLIDGLITYQHGGGSGSSDGFAYTVADSGIAAAQLEP